MEKGFELIGLEKEKTTLELAARKDFPTLLIGETGIGKTYVLHHLAREQGKSITRVSLNGEIGVNELLGKWLAKDGSTYWQDGVLISCMRHGHWIILDEINAALPEVLFCLNALLDDSRSLVLAEKDGEVVTPSEGFRLFATMNPPEEYVGTKELNKALLSRFPIVICMKEYDPDTELKIIRYQSEVNPIIGAIMVDVANAVRELKRNRKIYYTCSTRDIVNWARLLKADGMGIEDAFIFSILNKASLEEQQEIIKCLKKADKLGIEWRWNRFELDDFAKSITANLKLDIDALEKKKNVLVKKVNELLDKGEELKKAVKS